MRSSSLNHAFSAGYGKKALAGSIKRHFSAFFVKESAPLCTLPVVQARVLLLARHGRRDAMNDATLAHPQIDQLIAFGLGKVSPTESAEIERHVAECDACCQKLRTIPGDSLLALVRSADTKTRSPSDANKAEPFPHEVPADLARHPRYRLADWLGTGGMGTVYRAEHLIMERPVALKVIRRSLVAKPAAVERFRQEVKMAARLVHPNIVTAYDADQAGDTHFLVMEYVAGTRLDREVERHGPLPVRAACDL